MQSNCVWVFPYDIYQHESLIIRTILTLFLPLILFLSFFCPYSLPPCLNFAPLCLLVYLFGGHECH